MVDQGYDVSDYLAVDPLYGGDEVFDKLISKAKDHNLRVLLDFVPNHSSDQHEWFRQSIEKVEPYTNYYVWHDGRPSPKNGSRPDPPNNWVSRYGGSAWEWNPARGQFYLHTYSAHQPDLNFRTRRVELEMEKAIRFWLHKGVDGFRMIGVANLYENEDFLNEPVASHQNYNLSNYDSLAHPFTTNQRETLAMVFEWRQLLDLYSTEIFSRLLIVDVKSDYLHVLPYYGDKSNPGALPVNPLFVTHLGKWSTAAEYGYYILSWEHYMNEGRWSNWMLGDPDASRVASRDGEGRVDLMNVLCLLLPGTAFTYYGEELGMLDTVLEPGQSNTINAARAPFQWDSTTSAGFSTNSKPWLPVHPNYHFENLQQQEYEKHSHYSTYVRLVAMRREPSFAKGSIVVTGHSANVLSFLRRYKSHDAFLVIINFGHEIESVQLSIYNLTNRLHVHTASEDSSFKVGESVFPGKVEIEPQSAVILTTGKVKQYTSRAGPSVQLSSAVLLALGVTLPVLYSFYN